MAPRRIRSLSIKHGAKTSKVARPHCRTKSRHSDTTGGIMDIFYLVKRLQSLAGPDIETDEMLHDFLTTLPTEGRKFSAGYFDKWIAQQSIPAGARTPKYTESLDSALTFAQSVALTTEGGIGWEAGDASAKIGADGHMCLNSQPAIAICLSSLLSYAKLNLAKR